MAYDAAGRVLVSFAMGYAIMFFAAFMFGTLLGSMVGLVGIIGWSFLVLYSVPQREENLMSLRCLAALLSAVAGFDFFGYKLSVFLFGNAVLSLVIGACIIAWGMEIAAFVRAGYLRGIEVSA
jgi:hypothetical protein